MYIMAAAIHESERYVSRIQCTYIGCGVFVLGVDACLLSCSYMFSLALSLRIRGTGWRRPMGCRISQVTFRKLATQYRALFAENDL